MDERISNANRRMAIIMEEANLDYLCHCNQIFSWKNRKLSTFNRRRVHSQFHNLCLAVELNTWESAFVGQINKAFSVGKIGMKELHGFKDLSKAKSISFFRRITKIGSEIIKKSSVYFLPPGRHAPFRGRVTWWISFRKSPLYALENGFESKSLKAFIC